MSYDTETKHLTLESTYSRRILIDLDDVDIETASALIAAFQLVEKEAYNLACARAAIQLQGLIKDLIG